VADRRLRETGPVDELTDADLAAASDAGDQRHSSWIGERLELRSELLARLGLDRRR
jgi:hypothetical protein